MDAESNRMYRLDLLRIAATSFILILHFLDRGGYLSKSMVYSEWWFLSWLLEGLSFTGVDLYVIISAFFLIENSDVRLGKIFNLWGQVFFTSIVISTVMSVTGFAFDKMDYLYTFLPFITKQAWFVNVYILMYLLHPFMNMLIARMNRKQYRLLLLVVLVFFCIAQSVIPEKTWTMDSSEGCGILWFCTLYFATGYFKKYIYENKDEINRVFCIKILVLSVCAMVFSKGMLHLSAMQTGHGGFAENIWFHFDSLPVFAASFALFGLFLSIREDQFSAYVKKIISFISPATLGIYLISAQFKLHMHLWTDILHVNRYINSWKMIPVMIFSVLIVFTFSLLIDKFRHLLAEITINRFGMDKKIDLWQKRIITKL